VSIAFFSTVLGKFIQTASLVFHETEAELR